MGKQTGLQLIYTIQPSAALVQIHPLVPFAPFLKSSVYKAPQVIQISFDKVIVVVLPSPHQWIQTIRNHIYTTRPGTDSMIGILPSTNYNQDFILNFLRFIQKDFGNRFSERYLQWGYDLVLSYFLYLFSFVSSVAFHQ